MGFLGAGTIIKSADGGLTGLTTATTIWTAAALGLCSGSASLDYRLCLIAVALVVACLQLVILFVSRHDIAAIWVAFFSRSHATSLLTGGLGARAHRGDGNVRYPSQLLIPRRAGAGDGQNPRSAGAHGRGRRRARCVRLPASVCAPATRML